MLKNENSFKILYAICTGKLENYEKSVKYLNLLFKNLSCLIIILSNVKYTLMKYLCSFN